MPVSSVVVPHHLRKITTKKALSSLELRFLELLGGDYAYLLKHLSRDDTPYQGHKFKSDFILPMPGHPQWKGISIELQGGVMQGTNRKSGRSGPRTGHTSASGIARDYEKMIVSQLNGWFFLPVITGDANLLKAISLLDRLYMDYCQLTDGERN